jgi:hypothetical protein
LFSISIFWNDIQGLNDPDLKSRPYKPDINTILHIHLMSSDIFDDVDTQSLNVKTFAAQDKYRMPADCRTYGRDTGCDIDDNPAGNRDLGGINRHSSGLTY